MADQRGAAELVAGMQQQLAAAKATIAALEDKVGELQALFPAAAPTSAEAQQQAPSSELGHDVEEDEEIEVVGEEIECAVCDNPIPTDLIIDLGTVYEGSSVVVCKLCYYHIFRHGRGADRPPVTSCPRTQQALNKDMIECMAVNKQGRAKFSPTRGIAKGCKACKWPKDGRGCKHCVYPYNAHGRMQVNPEWAPYLVSRP